MQRLEAGPIFTYLSRICGFSWVRLLTLVELLCYKR